MSVSLAAAEQVKYRLFRTPADDTPQRLFEPDLPPPIRRAQDRMTVAFPTLMKSVVSARSTPNAPRLIVQSITHRFTHIASRVVERLKGECHRSGHDRSATTVTAWRAMGDGVCLTRRQRAIGSTVVVVEI